LTVVAVGPDARGADLIMADEVEWFVGIDWASENHRVCPVDACGQCVGERSVAHGGAMLGELCDWLMAGTGARPEAIAVAIEMPNGPVVEALLERGFRVHAINPKQLDGFRDRFTVAGAKDDSRDARVLADSLRTDRPAFRQVSVDDPVIVELREWSRIADDLQQERNRLANRVREQLWRYYPQMLELPHHFADGWFLDLWSQALDGEGWEGVNPPPQGASESTKRLPLIASWRIGSTSAASPPP
jgi:Transposase